MILLLALLLPTITSAQARRLVIIKVDGLGQDLLARTLAARDPSINRSELPWIHRVFVEQGAIVANFYVRGISLSVPSWSMLDTGRHPVIHGNAEFDRATGRVYDYLNFFPFYFRNARDARADMPAVEVLDEAGIPLLIDSLRPSQQLQSMQLFQRGVRWQTLKSTLPRRLKRSPRELFNEWQTGFALTEAVNAQVEHELIQALAGDRLLYLDFFFGDYDHIAHLANDQAAQREVLVKLDLLVGRIWSAIERSPLARETVLVLVSDHGMNTDPSTYSQGFNLVNFFGSAAAGGHHVLTNRHPESEYKLKGLDPFVSHVVTASRESPYLQDQAEQYPTALLDLDGNERAAVYLRNSDVNAMHILLQQLSAAHDSERSAIGSAIIAIVDRHRAEWTATAQELDAELAALDRAIRRARTALPPEPKKLTAEERHDQAGLAWQRRRAEIESWERQFREYSVYRRWLETELKLTPADISAGKVKMESLIPRRAPLDRNTIYQLQNYVWNASPAGIGEFERVDYFPLLTGIRVRNNSQPGVSSAPVDFVAVPIPAGVLRPALGADEWPDSDAIWLYASEQRQALILPRRKTASLKYLPVRGLRQDAGGRISFERLDPVDGLPLRYFEDPALGISGSRAAWFQSWHTEAEWFRATHRTRYSNGIVGLAQHFAPIEIGPAATLWLDSGADQPLLRRFALRLREMAWADLLIVANDHWNFNARGFNPGGNHGSFLRISTHSVLLLAGAGIPAGLQVETPYDSLSFVPTILALTGRSATGYPGPVIEEVMPKRDAERSASSGSPR